VIDNAIAPMMFSDCKQMPYLIILSGSKQLESLSRLTSQVSITENIIGMMMFSNGQLTVGRKS
jgi:hypothetical protein